MVLCDTVVSLEDPFDDAALDTLSLFEVLDSIMAVGGCMHGRARACVRVTCVCVCALSLFEVLDSIMAVGGFMYRWVGVGVRAQLIMSVYMAVYAYV